MTIEGKIIDNRWLIYPNTGFKDRVFSTGDFASGNTTIGDMLFIALHVESSEEEGKHQVQITSRGGGPLLGETKTKKTASDGYSQEKTYREGEIVLEELGLGESIMLEHSMYRIEATRTK